MTLSLDYDTALESLRAVAAERPDFVYNPDGEAECIYFKSDGTPSCLVGQVLAQNGATASALRPFNNYGVDGLVACGILDVDDMTRRALTAAQSAQDGGRTWAEAVHRAEAVQP